MTKLSGSQKEKTAENTTRFFSTLKKILTHFNTLSPETINPLLAGLFLIGVSMNLFEFSTTAYLTMMYGASIGAAMGVTYAGSKYTLTEKIPEWALPVFGLTSACIYAIAGIPGVFLAIGISSGWYIRSHYQDQFQAKFQEWQTNFKEDPINSGITVLFKSLEVLSNFILKEIEPPQTAKQKIQPPEPAVPPILNTPTPSSTPPLIAATPVPVLFSAPTTTRSKKPNPAAHIPFTEDKNAVFGMFGHTLVSRKTKEIALDNSWFGIAKGFIYSLDPAVDFVSDKTEKNNSNNGPKT